MPLPSPLKKHWEKWGIHKKCGCQSGEALFHDSDAFRSPKPSDGISKKIAHKEGGCLQRGKAGSLPQMDISPRQAGLPISPSLTEDGEKRQGAGERARTDGGDVCTPTVGTQSCLRWHHREEPVLCRLINSPLKMAVHMILLICGI